MAGSASALDLPNDDAVISAGVLYQTCGLKADGSVDCWGDNTYGQAADQDGPFTQVSAGAYHTCGLKADGSVDCWGLNNYGQADNQDGPFTQLSVGSLHTCGLKTDGSVDCWGDNSSGQAADQTGPFTRVSAGGGHTCGLKTDGSIDCWGVNINGQAADQPGPFIQVSAAGAHTCGLKDDGSVDCWGNNSNGQATDQTGPFIQVSAAAYHTCALRSDGSVDCWGRNNYGQAEDQSGPFAQVSASSYHTCGLKGDGSVDCWGRNNYGQAEDQAGPFAPYDENSTPDDTTAPVITPTVMGNRNNGWYFGDVEVGWTVTDDESTITSTSGCDTTLIDSDTAGLTLTCEATSEGGTTAESVTIQRDATAPTTTANVSPAANTNGWHNSDVTVSFSGSDETSGIAACSDPIILSSEGANQAPGGSCSDNAGNVSTAGVSINIDKSAPVVSVTGVEEGAIYILGDVPAASCATNDALSGVAVEAGLTLSGGNPDGSGSITATCDGALDNAGNSGAASVIYTVLTPQDATAVVQGDIQTLIDEDVLKPGQANGLTKPLENTIRSLDKGNTVAACNQLGDFIGEVNAKTPNPLDTATAAELIADAQAIQNAIGCVNSASVSLRSVPTESTTESTIESTTVQNNQIFLPLVSNE